MFSFITFLKDWETLISGILSGAIAGFLTYLGVMLTLKKQAKSEYPKKLVAISEMTDAVQEHVHKLMEFEFFLIRIKESGEDCDLKTLIDNFYLNSNFSSKKLLKKAAYVDKKTYQIVLSYGYCTPNEMKLFGYGVVWKGDLNIDHVIDSCKGYQNDLLAFNRELFGREQYYENLI